MSYEPVIHPRPSSGSPPKEKKKLIFTYPSTPARLSKYDGSWDIWCFMPGVKHSGYHATIPLNKVEFIALGHTLGWVLPWIRPHCKGYRSTIPFDLRETPQE